MATIQQLRAAVDGIAANMRASRLSGDAIPAPWRDQIARGGGKWYALPVNVRSVKELPAGDGTQRRYELMTNWGGFRTAAKTHGTFKAARMVGKGTFSVVLLINGRGTVADILKG